jgi:hypothetical protein
LHQLEAHTTVVAVDFLAVAAVFPAVVAVAIQVEVTASKYLDNILTKIQKNTLLKPQKVRKCNQ